MIITFASLSVSAYQDSKRDYKIHLKETELYSGDMHVTLSTATSAFPISFDCYTASYTEISALVALIGTFGTLIIDGVSYTYCYISDFGSVFEVVRGSGKYTYSISFGQADQH
jgi:hypothetical protein